MAGSVSAGHKFLKKGIFLRNPVFSKHNAPTTVRRLLLRPAPIEEVVAAIKSKKPDVVFAPHVETSSGMLLPDDYLRKLADAVHAVGGLFVLDCIASGTIWVDMEVSGVDVLNQCSAKRLECFSVLCACDAQCSGTGTSGKN